MEFSVLMSVYYKENPFLFNRSLESLYNQITSPSEIILVVDGPLNKELDDVINYWKFRFEDKLRPIRLEKNFGLAYALNVGLSKCRYEWVARMDSDDISYPNRFLKQVEFIGNNNVDVVGAWAYKINVEEVCIGKLIVPIAHEQIKKLIWSCPFNHPTVMYRKSLIMDVGSYNVYAGPRQDDYDLWFRCCQNGLRMANIPEVLLGYRYNESNIRKNNIKVGIARFKVGLKGCIKNKCGISGYLGIAFPLVRSLLPYPLNILVHNFFNKLNPRNKIHNKTI